MDDEYLVTEAAEGDLLDMLELHAILHGEGLGVQQHEGVSRDH